MHTAPARWAVFTAVAVVMTGHGLGSFTTHVPGDPGDAFFNLYVLEWGAHSLRTGLVDYWAGAIFLGSHLPMAYSDTHLGVVPLHAVLREVTSPVVSFNLIFVATWALAAECTYLLARRCTGHRGASLVAALGFTYATIRLGQYFHWQLSFGALLPALVLLVLVVLDGGRSRWRAVARGALLGATWALMTLSASYYGVLALIGMAVLAAARLLRGRGRLPVGAWPGLLAAGAVALVLVGPVAVRYLELQQDPAFRRGYEAQFAGRWEDYRTVRPDNRFLGDAPLLRSTSPTRSSENFAFPGVVVLVAGLAGVPLVARRRWWVQARLPAARWADTAALAVVGVVALLLSLGRNTTVMGLPLLPNLYDPAAAVVPGFKGIRAPIRLAVLAQLALAVGAAVALAAAARWWTARRAVRPLPDRPVSAGRVRVPQVVAVVLAGLVLVETRTVIDASRPPLSPKADGAAVNLLLADLPQAGVVELPMAQPDDGVVWGFLECRRMLLATLDWHPRLGGYSGFIPPGYQALVNEVRSFPSPSALERLDALGVRYVVLRTAPVPSGATGVDQFVEASGLATMAAADAESLVAAVPPERLAAVQRVQGAVLVTLSPPAAPSQAAAAS